MRVHEIALNVHNGILQSPIKDVAVVFANGVIFSVVANYFHVFF